MHDICGEYSNGQYKTRASEEGIDLCIFEILNAWLQWLSQRFRVAQAGIETGGCN